MSWLWRLRRQQHAAKRESAAAVRESLDRRRQVDRLADEAWRALQQRRGRP